MSLSNRVKRLADTRRLIDLERLKDGDIVPGDFKGSVIAYYSKRNNDGTVTIEYNSKSYIARPQAKYQAVAGDIVTLSYRDGVYIASW